MADEAGKDRTLEKLTAMSDDDHDRPLIRNQETLQRRAWIEQAIASVRARLRVAELGEGATPPPEPQREAAESRPRLYVVKR